MAWLSSPFVALHKLVPWTLDNEEGELIQNLAESRVGKGHLNIAMVIHIDREFLVDRTENGTSTSRFIFIQSALLVDRTEGRTSTPRFVFIQSVVFG
jgi:hypothetical protein